MDETGRAVLEVFHEISSDVSMSDEELFDAQLIDRGIIDSLRAIRFVSELEQRFDIQFTGEEIASDQFETLRGIAEVIQRKQEEEG